MAIENDIQGTVTIRFLVNKYGKVEQVSVYRGVDPFLDAEALRVIKILLDFELGIHNSRPVNVWMTIPIVFKPQ